MTGFSKEVRREGILVAREGEPAPVSEGDRQMLEFFPELADALIETRRDAPRLADQAAELLSMTVKAHYVEGDYENAVRLGELFVKAHGIYWPTSIDTANSRDLLNLDVEACVAEHRGLIDDMLNHSPEPGTEVTRLSPLHARTAGNYTLTQWSRYLSMVRLNLAGILRRLGRLGEAREELELSLEGLEDATMRVNRYMRLAHLAVISDDATAALQFVELARKTDLERYDQWLIQYKPMYPELDRIV